MAKEFDKKKAEGPTQARPDGSPEKPGFISGETLDYSIDIRSYLEAVMADNWFYFDARQVRGPVAAARVRQLLASGEIQPDQELWSPTSDRKLAGEVRKGRDFAPTPGGGTPDWLQDVAQAEESGEAAKPAGEPELDWLADVEIPPEPVPVVEEVVDVLPVEVKLPVVRGTPVPAASPPKKVDRLEELAAEVMLEGSRLPPSPRWGGPRQVSVGGATSVGMVRNRNEDRFFVQHLLWNGSDECHEVCLIAVIDGMGGHQAGDKASSLAIRTLALHLAPILAGIMQGPNVDAGKAVLTRHLDRAIQEAHSAIAKRAESDPNCKGMGATGAVVLVWNDLAFIRHVGDCRVYHLHGGELKQITRDQTLVARMVELGQLKAAEAANHPNRNEVTQAFGKRGVLEPSQQELLLTAGDRLVVCCDGLTNHVDDATLGSIVSGWTGTSAELANRLVDLANEGGGSDNCTVVIASCS
jgi:protein phosphatase